MADGLRKIWAFEPITSYDGSRAFLLGGVVVNVSDGRRFEISVPDGADGLRVVFDFFNNRGAAFVFVWDMSFWGMFCDYYALRDGLPEFKDAKKRKGGTGAAEPCYTMLYAAGRGTLCARLTLRRTGKTHEYGSGNIGGLHTVEYRGMSAFFPAQRREDVGEACGGGSENTADQLARIVRSWAREYSALVGESVLSAAYMKSVYTVGGAARRAYLGIRYGTGARLSRYQKEHDCAEKMEDYLRRRRLLLSGMCFFGDNRKHELTEGHLYKWDVNGLYSATADEAGELSYPRAATFDDFMKDRDIGHTYIIVVKGLTMYRRPNMPAAFCNPFTRSGGDVVSIPEEFALFRELWDALREYYIFEEYDVVKVLRCDIRPDHAIVEYNKTYEREKERAAKDGREVARVMCKGLLNNLIGKFAQATKYTEIIGFYDEKNDVVRFKQGDEVNNWERGHFDFVRGAYIYTLARVRVMHDIARVCGADGSPVVHHWYTDTDSIVTDCEIPPDMMDSFVTGKYKLEREYSAFGIFAKKVYYGRTVDGRDKLTAAGIPKGLIISDIREKYGDGLTAAQTWDILCMPTDYYIPIDQRVPGGGAKIMTPVRLAQINVDKYL